MRLYTQLAKIYHGMYQSLFDYRKEFRFYDRILERHGCSSVLEIGCGTGNLAPYFLRKGYDYTGLDLHEEMLAIAREVEPRARFVQGDMRSLKSRKKYDAMCVTGRTFVYLTKNEDVLSALGSIRKALKPEGILVFDAFRAESIFREFRKRTSTTVRFGGTKVRRTSDNRMNLASGWTFDWNATYTVTRRDAKPRVFRDSSVLRAFTEDELRLFLEMTGYRTERVFRKGTFAFVASRAG